MILNINTVAKEFVVTANPEPKVDQNGIQRADKQTGEPMWATELVVTDDSGGEIIKVTTAGKRPDVERGDVVDVVNLVAIPWVSKARTGVAFRADAIEPDIA